MPVVLFVFKLLLFFFSVGYCQLFRVLKYISFFFQLPHKSCYTIPLCRYFPRFLLTCDLRFSLVHSWFFLFSSLPFSLPEHIRDHFYWLLAPAKIVIHWFSLPLLLFLRQLTVGFSFPCFIVRIGFPHSAS